MYYFLFVLSMFVGSYQSEPVFTISVVLAIVLIAVLLTYFIYRMWKRN
ncbi:TPA: hypothetical protein VDU83_002678 [Pseudomonas aeruginosa]|nr:hypothetical protein [Pseudomonas aeruginosa]